MTSAADSSAAQGDNRDFSILRVLLAYAAFASLLILLSDLAEGLLLGRPFLIVWADIMKGWLFVGVTTALLHRLMRRLLGGMGTAAPRTSFRRSMVVLLAVLAMTVVSLMAIAIAHTFVTRKQQEIANLRVIADLKTRQVSDWLKERQADASFIAEDYRRWPHAGGTRLGQLRSRLDQFGKFDHVQSVLLLNTDGDGLWDSGGAPSAIEGSLRAAARKAATASGAGMLGPYRDSSGRLRLDFLVPLPAADGRTDFVVVLRTDPANYLSSVLQAWPSHQGSGETLIFRNDGDQVLCLNELRHRSDTAATLHLPLTRKELLSVQVVRGDNGGSDLVEGMDYRNVPALGIVRAIPGTDWFLIAKVDKAEIYGDAAANAFWIVLAGLLVLFVAAAGSFLLHVRQQLNASRRERDEQMEKLRALQLLETIAGNSPDVIFAKDRASRYLFLNEGTARFIGKPVAEVLGRDETALLSPAEAAVIMAEDQRVMAENKVISYEDNLMTQVGLTTFLTTKGPVRDAEGRVVGLFGIARDITERKQVEDQLRKLSWAVEQSPTSIIITDLDANIEYVNEACLRITGYRRDEMIGRSTRLFKSGRTPAETYAALWHDLTNGRSWQGEFCNRRKDGSEFTEFAIVTPIRQPDGRITHYVAVKEDVTEKKRLRMELRRHRDHLEQLVAQRTEELQAILDAIPAAVLIAHDPLCRHITCNPAGSQIFAVGQGDNVSATAAAPARAADYRVFDADGRELQPEELAMHKAAALGCAIPAAEYRVRFGDGRQVWLYGNASPLFDHAGEVRGVVGVFSDITERKEWEQTLERRVADRTAELTAANKELEGFTYAASHDMKAPLGRINSFSTLLSRQYRGQLEGDGLMLLDLIQQNAVRLNALVEDLLAHAQVGQHPLAPQRLPVLAAVHAILQEQHEEIEKNGARIRLDFPVEITVQGDPLSFSQVLRNLLENALKYSSQAKPPVIEIGGRLEDRTGRLWVRDNGIGIDSIYQEQIFEIFRRLHTYSEYPGTGIGLALVKKAMDRMAGKVWVESELGQGATFYLELPA